MSIEPAVGTGEMVRHREPPPVEGEPHLPGRRETVTVDVGGVRIGSRHPVVVQSMTNTDTADADATEIGRAHV